MSLPEQIFFVCLLGYFLVLNSLYLAIRVAALVQLHRENGRRYIDFGRLEVSAATLPVSVLIPAYNEAEILSDALTALLASNYGEFEIIVVNDGSTDDTVGVARRDF